MHPAVRASSCAVVPEPGGPGDIRGGHANFQRELVAKNGCWPTQCSCDAESRVVQFNARRRLVGVEAIPQSLAGRSQWLVWKFEQKEGDKKPRKVPYYATGRRRVGEQGTPEDRAKLCVLDEAVRACTAHGMSGVGFAFLPGDGLIGIDIDGAIDTETGEISERARKIIESCSSYTEYSPSRRGVHIIVAGESETFKSNDIGLEVFCGRQFFTFTGERYSGTPEEVCSIDPGILRRLRATVDQAKGKRGLRAVNGGEAPPPPTDDRAKLESALAVVNADLGYDDWVQVGMALYKELGAGGLDVWDQWSSRSQKYPGRKGLETHWRSFERGGVNNRHGREDLPARHGPGVAGATAAIRPGRQSRQGCRYPT
jgi:putative DNA primase/helicase